MVQGRTSARDRGSCATVLRLAVSHSHGSASRRFIVIASVCGRQGPRSSAPRAARSKIPGSSVLPSPDGLLPPRALLTSENRYGDSRDRRSRNGVARIGITVVRRPPRRGGIACSEVARGGSTGGTSTDVGAAGARWSRRMRRPPTRATAGHRPARPAAGDSGRRSGPVRHSQGHSAACLPVPDTGTAPPRGARHAVQPERRAARARAALRRTLSVASAVGPGSRRATAHVVGRVGRRPGAAHRRFRRLAGFLPRPLRRRHRCRAYAAAGDTASLQRAADLAGAPFLEGFSLRDSRRSTSGRPAPPTGSAPRSAPCWADSCASCVTRGTLGAALARARERVARDVLNEPAQVDLMDLLALDRVTGQARSRAVPDTGPGARPRARSGAAAPYPRRRRGDPGGAGAPATGWRICCGARGGCCHRGASWSSATPSSHTSRRLWRGAGRGGSRGGRDR